MKSEIDNVVSDVLGQEHAIIKHVLRTTCHTVIKALVKFTLVGLPYVMMDTFRDLFETYTSFQTSYRAILRNVWLWINNWATRQFVSAELHVTASWRITDEYRKLDFVVGSMHTDTAEGSLVITTALIRERFGWTMFTAVVQRQTSHTVDTTAGAFMTVHTEKMYLSAVTRVMDCC